MTKCQRSELQTLKEVSIWREGDTSSLDFATSTDYSHQAQNYLKEVTMMTVRPYLL